MCSPRRLAPRLWIPAQTVGDNEVAESQELAHSMQVLGSVHVLAHTVTARITTRGSGARRDEGDSTN